MKIRFEKSRSVIYGRSRRSQRPVFLGPKSFVRRRKLPIPRTWAAMSQQSLCRHLGASPQTHPLLNFVPVCRWRDESSSLLSPTTLEDLESLALGNNPTLAQSQLADRCR